MQKNICWTRFSPCVTCCFKLTLLANCLKFKVQHFLTQKRRPIQLVAFENFIRRLISPIVLHKKNTFISFKSFNQGCLSGGNSGESKKQIFKATSCLLKQQPSHFFCLFFLKF